MHISTSSTLTLVGALLALSFAACSSGGGAHGAGGVGGGATGGAGGSLPRVPGVPAVTAKGDPSGAPAQATIGASGGQLASADGALTVIVPPGALAADTEIGIQPITALAPGALGKGYRLTPEGQTFAAPARLVFTTTDAELAGTALAAIHVEYQDATGQWRSLKNVVRDAAARTVAVTTSHFSDWEHTAGLKLTPASASIQTGQSVNLLLTECIADTIPGTDDELADLRALTCTQSGESARWAANGVAGGNGPNGTVTELSPGDAVYVAPNQTPAPNPVAVSAEIAQTDGSKITVVSNITVGGQPAWVGSSRTDTVLTVEGGGGVTRTTVDASVRWTWSEADEIYHAIGALTVTYDLQAPGCMTTAHAEQTIAGMDGSLTVGDLIGTGKLQYAGGGYTSIVVAGTSTCNDGHVPEAITVIQGPVGWWMVPSGYAPVSADGHTIEGSTSTPVGLQPQTESHWKFTSE